MAQSNFGRIVRVRVPYLNGGGFADEIWYAAIDDDDDAEDAVRRASGSEADITVSVVGRLVPNALTGLGLAPGKVRVGA